MTEFDDEECALCWEELADSRGMYCQDCRNWLAYWESLTPKQKADEIAMMDAYAREPTP